MLRLAGANSVPALGGPWAHLPTLGQQMVERNSAEALPAAAYPTEIRSRICKEIMDSGACLEEEINVLERISCLGRWPMNYLMYISVY